MARGLVRGDIHLYRFPPPDKERPVLVLTRETVLGYLMTATVAPITSTIRDVPAEVLLAPEDGMKSLCAINFHNIVTVPQSQMGPRIARLSPERLKEVCAAIHFALGCDAD